MWDKINKVQAQVIACMLIIILSYVIAGWAAVKGLAPSSEIYINKVTDITLLGAVAWLFRMAGKTNNNNSNN